ncbi:hypothetical protein OXYTRIMIC_721 [Oxytricha trifallax]|uniref:Uncharacterized protein n=1 Tax=Oxytricha trifallax TaxID=1172189 RepID=A0A073I0U4_9SPIT|nr:hypothetical protein OXYTRIMIC_721 [Oxytricha trifallax]
MKEIYTQISAQQGEVQLIQTNQDEFFKESIPSTSTWAVQQFIENSRVYLKIRLNIKLHFCLNTYQLGVETELKDAYLKGDTQIVTNYLKAARTSLRKIVLRNVLADMSSVSIQLFDIKEAQGPRMLKDQVKFDNLKVILRHLQDIQTYLLE